MLELGVAAAAASSGDGWGRGGLLQGSQPFLLRWGQREAPRVQRPAAWAQALTGATSLPHKRGPLPGQAVGAGGRGALQGVAACFSAPRGLRTPRLLRALLFADLWPAGPKEVG